VYTERVVEPCAALAPADVDRDLDDIGGDLGWYGLVPLWRARLLFGRILGERWAKARPERVEAGARVDWWTVVDRRPGRLVLRGRDWAPGDAWLGYEVVDDRLVQVGALRTKGVIGFLYWKALVPVHRRVFVELARYRVARIRADSHDDGDGGDGPGHLAESWPGLGHSRRRSRRSMVGRDRRGALVHQEERT
jgi:hypothetical protein